MERLLTPDKLDVDPNSTNAEKQFNYWKKTFDNFINECGDRAPDKLRCLIKYVSASIYEHFAESTTFESAMTILNNLYVKKKNEIFSRHLLATRRQSPSESIDEFLQDLHRLSKNCKLQDLSASQYREELVRDSFINGILSSNIRQRLLENQTLTLTQAYDQAMALDFAQRNSGSFQTSSTVAAAAKQTEVVSDDSVSDDENVSAASTKKKCWFCGGPIHSRSKCPARKSDCSNCGIKGHWAKVCKSSQKQKFTGALLQSKTRLCAASVPDCLQDSSVKITINDNETFGIIDSASSNSFINYKTAREFKIDIEPSKQQITLAQSSSKASIVGECTVNITLNGNNYQKIKLGVMKNLCADVLLGIDFQKQHSSVTIEYGGSRSPLKISNSNNHAVCSLAEADIPKPSLFANMKKNVKPIVTKSRIFTSSNKEFIAKEIKSLLAEGVIEPCISPWRAQVVISTDEFNRHRKRMCIDYSTTVNIYTDLDAYPLPRIDTMVNTLAEYKYFSTFDLKSAYHQIPICESDKPYTAFEANGKLYQFTRVPFGITNGVSVFQRAIDKIVEDEGLKDTFPYLDNITVAGKTQEEHDDNVKKFLAVVKKKNLTLNESKTVSSTETINVLGYQIKEKEIKPDPERLRVLQELPPPSNKAGLQRILGMFAYYAKWIPKFSDEAKLLYKVTTFPMNSDELSAFEKLKTLLGKAALGSIDETTPFVIECDASDVAVSATLNQAGRPVAFMSRTLSGSEVHYPAVEKEATAIIEAVRKWSHLLSGRRFTIITDQRSVAFMLDNRRRSKIKNDKIQCWRLELASFNYSIQYRPGKENVAPDAFTRAHCSAMQDDTTLTDLHEDLCHPGVTRMLHFVRTKNLPYSTDDVKKTCSSCRVCAEQKPRFHRPTKNTLIKATHPMERLSVDFKGPLPSNSKNKFIFTAVDEYSRFPFAIPCPDTSSNSVIQSLDTIFSMCGMPNYIHSDRGSAFMSRDVQEYLACRGIASSKSTPYHPTGNSQCERYNGIIWKSVTLAIKSQQLSDTDWEKVLPQALHSIRSLLTTSTNETPHERFFNFQRRSGLGSSLPTWLCSPGPVFLRRFVRQRKSDPLVDEVELLHANPTYAHIRHCDGRESTVALKDLAPCPKNNNINNDRGTILPVTTDFTNNETNEESQSNQTSSSSAPATIDNDIPVEIDDLDVPDRILNSPSNDPRNSPTNEPRRSQRPRQIPDRLGY